jgi:hypothetical protein
MSSRASLRDLSVMGRDASGIPSRMEVGDGPSELVCAA